MKKYTLIFGTDLRGRNKLDSPETYKYYDKNDSKTLGDVKDCITCFNDSLCTCMLKLFTDNNHRFNGNDNDKAKLKEISREDKIYIGQIEQECKCGFLRLNKNLISLSKRNVIEKVNDLEKKEELGTIQARDFYDVIININSIRDVNKGLKIEMSEIGEKNYKMYRENQFLKIGILGGINKGKSFILSKLSKMKFPTGTSINTKGLSVRYPYLEEGHSNRKFILLDSAGFEKPILRSRKQLKKNEEEKKEEEKKEEEKKEEEKKEEEKKEEDINEIKEEKKEEEINEIKEEKKEEEINEIKEEKKEDNDDYLEFKSISRDILITESFLQSFIMSESDLLLVVVDALSLSEQKLLNKIKRVIHNLKTYRSIEQVEEYINETLLKSVSFELRKDEPIRSEKNNQILGYHFTETNVKDISIFHLMFAADGSDAGNFYNKYTLNFIEEQYGDNWKKEAFDVIKEIKSKISEYSRRYLEQKIESNEFRSDEDDLNEKLIKLKKEKELSLKECIIDEMGFQTFKMNGFEPQYNYFIKEIEKEKEKENEKDKEKEKDKILEIRVELPGNVVPKILPVKYMGENTIIGIEGEKKKDKDPKNIDDNIFNSRDFGKFFVEIQFKTEDYKIKTELKKLEVKKGILFLQYDIDPEKKEEKIELKEEDEI